MPASVSERLRSVLLGRDRGRAPPARHLGAHGRLGDDRRHRPSSVRCAQPREPGAGVSFDPPERSACHLLGRGRRCPGDARPRALDHRARRRARRGDGARALRRGVPPRAQPQGRRAGGGLRRHRGALPCGRGAPRRDGARGELARRGAGCSRPTWDGRATPCAWRSARRGRPGRSRPKGRLRAARPRKGSWRSPRATTEQENAPAPRAQLAAAAAAAPVDASGEETIRVPLTRLGRLLRARRSPDRAALRARGGRARLRPARSRALRRHRRAGEGAARARGKRRGGAARGAATDRSGGGERARAHWLERRAARRRGALAREPGQLRQRHRQRDTRAAHGTSCLARPGARARGAGTRGARWANG